MDTALSFVQKGGGRAFWTLSREAVKGVSAAIVRKKCYLRIGQRTPRE
jgi:hypothetical protein